MKQRHRIAMKVIHQISNILQMYITHWAPWVIPLYFELQQLLTIKAGGTSALSIPEETWYATRRYILKMRGRR
jgi:hypothetical protein